MRPSGAHLDVLASMPDRGRMNDQTLPATDAERYREVLVALDALERNAPPVLALEALVARLRRV